MSEQNVGKTPWEDLRKNALSHYDEVSSSAHQWYNVVPRAINYYFDHANPEAMSNELSERIAREAVEFLFDDYPDNSMNREQATDNVAAIIDKHLAPQPAQPREVWNQAISLIPTNWVDPLLSGKESPLHGLAGTWNCQDIERLLLALRTRLAVARDAATAAWQGIESLPEWEECSDAFQESKSSPLQTFIAENEPAGDKDSKKFRRELLALINFCVAPPDTVAVEPPKGEQ